MSNSDHMTNPDHMTNDHMANPGSGTPTSRTGRRMARAGSLLAGGIAIGALFSPIGLAGAQTDPSPVVSASDAGVPADASTSPESAGRRGPGSRLDPAFLQDLLGLSGAELRDARSEGQTLAETAAAQGVSEAELVAALVSEATDRLDQAVEDGRVDADRAATIAADLEERITERVNQVPEGRPASGEGADRRFGPPFAAEVLADLGLDADALKAAMQDGSTLAEAAAAQGVDEVDLAAALMAQAEERLAQAVSDGRIDADRAAEIEAGIEQRVQDRLDGIRPERGRPGPGSGRGPSAGSDATEG